ncbi:MAG: AI-2E family transporter [Prevotella sp.]|nr:AI-2E family transporter [Prevotella sp.]
MKKTCKESAWKENYLYLCSIMDTKKYTFDNVVRGLLAAAIVVGVVMLLNRLSSVLLPFFVAWLLAYLLFPLVRFFQYKCRLRFRIVGVLCALLVVALVMTGFFLLVIPPMIDEGVLLKDSLIAYVEGSSKLSSVPGQVQAWIREHTDVAQLKELVTEEGFINGVKEAMPKVWAVVSQSVSVLGSLLSLTMILLYTVFILLDYEDITQGWPNLLPARYRPFAQQLAADVEDSMNRYFRGQGLIAFIVGVLFSIGFLIIDFPMAVGLGMFIGLLNMVPYLQTLGLIPCVILALVKTVETGQNFWVIMLMVLAVFAVVQSIQDGFLTPKIMGKVTGLNAAIILLSLSIWGSLLGMLGMIIALPLTTLLLSYYQRYLVRK